MVYFSNIHPSIQSSIQIASHKTLSLSRPFSLIQIFDRKSSFVTFLGLTRTAEVLLATKKGNISARILRTEVGLKGISNSSNTITENGLSTAPSNIETDVVYLKIACSD